MKIYDKEKWEKVKLGEIFELQMGKTPSRNKEDYWRHGENSWISISDIKNEEKYICDTKEKITDLAVEESKIKVIPKDTVIMSFKLSIGKLAITSKDMFTNEAIMAFFPKDKVEINNNYLFYSLKKVNWTEGTNKAVKGLTLNKPLIASKEIFLPNIEIQREIAKRLDKVMEILKTKRKILLQLDELSKSIFIEMFGDPIKNEKKWCMISLEKLCEEIGDGLHGTPLYDENGKYFFINGNNLNEGKIDINKNTKAIGVEEYKRLFIKLNKNTILISINGTLGKLAFYDDEKVILGKSVCYCNLKNEINKVFVYEVMNSNFFKEFLNNSSTKSTIKNVSLKTIRNFLLIVPPRELQDEFETKIKAIYKSKFLCTYLFKK